MFAGESSAPRAFRSSRRPVWPARSPHSSLIGCAISQATALTISRDLHPAITITIEDATVAMPYPGGISRLERIEITGRQTAETAVPSPGFFHSQDRSNR